MDYLTKISKMPRFRGCEEVIDLEEKLLCSNRRLKDWINANLASNFNYDDYVSIFLSIDKEGNVVDMNFRNSGNSKKNAGEFKRIFLNMPKWVPATDQKSGLPLASIIRVNVRLEAND